MKIAFVTLGAAATALGVLAVAPGLVGAGTTTRTSTGFAPLPRAAPVGQLSQYGHVRSLRPAGARFALRFDPALLATGVTAHAAATEDGVLSPGEPVSNDYYVIDESSRRLTYRVPRATPVTVLTIGGGAILSTRVTVAELSHLVAGKNPKGRPLFGSLSSGFWIRVRGDQVTSIDQQYLP